MRTCEICYLDYPVEEFFGLKCEHRYCRECLSEHLEVNIKDGNVIEIPCMMLGCQWRFDKEDIRRFGSKEIYDKYLQFKLNIDVELNPKLKWCPRPSCNRYIEKTGHFIKQVTCECGQKICLKCGEA